MTTPEPGRSVDWSELAVRLGTVHVEGESVTLSEVRRALEILLGEDELRAAVELAASERKGALLANCVLRLIRTDVAISHCIDLLEKAPGSEDREVLMRLMGDILNRSAAPRLLSVFSASNGQLQLLLLDILRSALQDGSVFPEDVEDLFVEARRSTSTSVSELAAEIASNWEELR